MKIILSLLFILFIFILLGRNKNGGALMAQDRNKEKKTRVRWEDAKPGVYPEISPPVSNEIRKNDSWSLFIEGENYILQYISGSHGGGLKSILISKEDFLLARDDKLTLDQLCAIYKVN